MIVFTVIMLVIVVLPLVGGIILATHYRHLAEQEAGEYRTAWESCKEAKIKRQFVVLNNSSVPVKPSSSVPRTYLYTEQC
jgi:hypothetical protein